MQAGGGEFFSGAPFADDEDGAVHPCDPGQALLKGEKGLVLAEGFLDVGRHAFWWCVVG